jgi:hypothetical protein
MMDTEHGEVTITVQNNIIMVKLQGAFNEYGAKKYTEGVKLVIKNFNGQRFAILVDNLEMLGGTPEAYQELEQHNKWLNTQNLIAKAMVISSAVTIDIIDLLSPARKIQTCKNFDNIKDAINWLETLY